MKNLIILFLLSFLFFSCKKERMFHITATNVATGERIPNLRYYVVELTSGTFGEKSKTVREGDLDENGEANFSMKIKNTTHEISVKEPENSCYRENISLTFGPDEDFFADFKFAPCTFYKNTISNVNCLGENDKFEFSISRFVDNNYENPWIIMGCSGYTPSQYSKIPMGNMYLKWIVTRNGVSNTFYDTVYMEENSYTDYTLNY